MTSRRRARSSVWVGAFEPHTQKICLVAETHALDRQSTFLRTTEPHTARQGMSKTRGSLNSERCPCDRKPEHRRFRRRKGTCRYTCPFVVASRRPLCRSPPVGRPLVTGIHPLKAV